MSSGNIKVVCRFRPQNKKEIARGAIDIVEIKPDATSVLLKGNPPHTFNFDRIFSPSTTQQQVYDYAAKPVVDDLFKGYNGTIFAYGQTGSGKTHTMQGPNIHDPEWKGIIPRMIETIFEHHIAEASENLEFLVKVSYVEIYMEKIRDLLDPEKECKIREKRDKTVYIEGVTEVYVTCEDDVIKVMDNGQENRSVASTNMNEASSRSHSIFVLTVLQKNLDTGTTMNGVLYLVDLAGSEKVGKTGATGQTLNEAKGINKSLSALGNVINALTDGKTKHIPYRDSKLTRILQQSLGGNSRTTLVVNCSPSSYNEEETISTLRFGTRAKTIKNKAKVNKEMSVGELKMLLEQANKQISKLKRYISGMEDELKLYRGDSPAPKNLEKLSSAPANLMSPGTRDKLPNVARIQDKCSKLEEELQASEDDKRAALDKQEELQDSIRDKEQELEALLRAVEELKEELKEAVAKQEEFEQENLVMVNKIAEMTITQKKLEYEKSEFQLTNETLESQHAEMKEQVEKLQQEVLQLEATNKELKEEQETSEKQRRRENRRAELEKEQSQILEGAKSLRMSLELDVNRVEEMFAQERSRENSVGSTEEKYSAYEAKVGALKLQNEKLEREKRDMANLIKALQAESADSEKLTQLIAQTPTMAAVLAEPDDSLANEIQIQEKKKPESLADEQKKKKQEEVIPGLEDLAIEEPLSLEDPLDLDFEIGEVGVEDMTFSGSPSEPPHSVIPASGPAPASTESFEMEMLRTEMNTQQESIESLRDENKRLQAFLKQNEEQHQSQLKELHAQRDAEWSKHTEDKRLKLEQELNDLRTKTAKKLAEFDSLKASLLRDLQNRCEKVIDLEMLLDEAREQYEQLLKKSSNKSLQKRNMFLERNLEQLTLVHQQLVNQNNALRLEKKVSEKKLQARNERIRGLEVLLTNAQEKLQQQAESHAAQIANYKQLVEDLKNNLEKASSRRRTSSLNTRQARIARPIRGGGGRRKSPPPAGKYNQTPVSIKGKGVSRKGSLNGVPSHSTKSEKSKQSSNGSSKKTSSGRFMSLFGSGKEEEEFDLHSNVDVSKSADFGDSPPSPYKEPL